METYVVRRSTIVIISLFLSACASISNVDRALVSEDDTTSDYVISVNADQVEQALEPDLELPNGELDATNLEQLLVMNLATYAGDWNLAASEGLKAALRSGDPRVAKVATMSALRARNYEVAISAGQLWQDLSPKEEDARNMLFLSLLGGGELELAIGQIEQFEINYQLDEMIRQVSGLVVRQSNRDSGLAVARHLTERYTSSAQAHVSAAYIAEHFRFLAEADLWAARALSLKPGWDLAGQMRARLLGGQGKLDQRRDFILEFVNNYPDSVAMRINLAAEFARDEEYQKAYDLVLDVLDTAPRDQDALRYAGALAEQLGDNALAAKHYRRALSLDPNNDDIRWALARQAAMEKKYATAERLFDDIRDPELLVAAQIQVANMRKETQGMRMALNTLLTIRPLTEEDYISIALNRHYLLTEEFMYEEALGYVNDALVYLPENIDLLYARALAAAELGRLSITEKDLRFIIKREPDNADALNALGYTLADQTDRFNEAKSLIEQALAIEPDQAHILDSMGWILYRLGEHEEAIEYLKRALEKSDNAEIAAHLGEVYWSNGDYDKARAVWSESLEREPTHPVLNATIERLQNPAGDAVREAPTAEESLGSDADSAAIQRFLEALD